MVYGIVMQTMRLFQNWQYIFPVVTFCKLTYHICQFFRESDKHGWRSSPALGQLQPLVLPDSFWQWWLHHWRDRLCGHHAASAGAPAHFLFHYEYAGRFLKKCEAHYGEKYYMKYNKKTHLRYFVLLCGNLIQRRVCGDSHKCCRSITCLIS